VFCGVLSFGVFCGVFLLLGLLLLRRGVAGEFGLKEFVALRGGVFCGVCLLLGLLLLRRGVAGLLPRLLDLLRRGGVDGILLLK